MKRYLRTTLYSLLIISLGGGMTGCTRENERDIPLHEQHQDTDTVPEDTDGTSPEDTDAGTDTALPPDVDEDVLEEADAESDAESDATETAETLLPGHQLCAVAGRSSNADFIALHCAGVHDTSGFQAQNDQIIWQPGAFQVIAR